MSEPGVPDTALTLDVVRARIFYLACDVESASPPAAILLRAVADAIEDEGIVQQFSAPASPTGVLSRLISQASAIRPSDSHAPDAGLVAERRLEVVNSQSAYKR